MNTENDHDYFRCVIEIDSNKSYNVTLESNDASFWVPKSLCEFKPDSKYANRGILEVESWFAKKEGMNGE